MKNRIFSFNRLPRLILVLLLTTVPALQIVRAQNFGMIAYPLLRLVGGETAPAHRSIQLDSSGRFSRFQNAAEAEYYRALKDAPAQPDPTEYRRQALRKYISILAPYGKSDANADRIIAAKLTELLDIDFYAACKAMIGGDYEMAKLVAFIKQLPPAKAAAIRKFDGWWVTNYDLEHAGSQPQPYPNDLPPAGYGWGKTVSSNVVPKAAGSLPARETSVDAAAEAKTAQLVVTANNQITAGDLAGALRSLTECLRLNPDATLCAGTRGLVYTTQGEYDKALADYNTAIRLNPKLSANYYYRSINYRKQKNPAAAFADLTKAIELISEYQFTNPKLYTKTAPRYYSERVEVDIDLNKTDAALADASIIIRIEPDKYLNYYRRALFYGALDQKEKAIADYRRALQLNPQFKEAKEALKALGVEP